MVIKIFWEKYPILNIIKDDNRYFSELKYDSLKEAEKHGMPITLLNQFQMISTKLPYFVKERLPNTANMVKNMTEEIKQIDVIEYINQTRCKCATDKFEIEIEE